LKCFICFFCMLQVLQLDVSKVDRLLHMDARGKRERVRAVPTGDVQRRGARRGRG
jgi:hypothetical protein